MTQRASHAHDYKSIYSVNLTVSALAKVAVDENGKLKLAKEIWYRPRDMKVFLNISTST